MFQIMQKLKSAKHDLKAWLKRNFGNFKDKFGKNTEKIEYVEERLIANPNSYRFNSWMQRLLKQPEKMMLFSQKY